MLCKNDNTTYWYHGEPVDGHFHGGKNKKKKEVIGRAKGILAKVKIAILGKTSWFQFCSKMSRLRILLR